MTKMLDQEMFEDYLAILADKYEAFDLIDILDDLTPLTSWDVIEAFRDKFEDIYISENE